MGTYTEMPVTVAALEGMPEDGNRYEVIEGELYVSTSLAFPHQSALGNLHFALAAYLKDHPIGRALLGLGVVFDEFNGVIPDLLFISNERLKRILAGGRLTMAPEIVIEILSPGSANENRDRVVKRKLYSSRGVSEYWVLDPETRTLEVQRKRKEGGLKRAVVLQPEDDLTSALLPEFRISIAELFE
jgi:Uma2 family endonuclease